MERVWKQIEQNGSEESESVEEEGKDQDRKNERCSRPKGKTRIKRKRIKHRQPTKEEVIGGENEE